MNLIDIYLSVCLWIVIGYGVGIYLSPRMAAFHVWVKLRDDSGSLFEWFLAVLLWPSTLIKYTSRETKAEIAAAKHGRFPWAFAPDGSEYSEDEKARRFEAMLRKGQVQ